MRNAKGKGDVQPGLYDELAQLSGVAVTDYDLGRKVIISGHSWALVSLSLYVI